MRSVVLSLVFCIAIQAAPAQRPDQIGLAIAERTISALVEHNTRLVDRVEHEQEKEHAPRNSDRQLDRPPEIIETGGSPALTQIFKDVEEIIESGRLSTEKKLNHIVDAIVHNEESRREDHLNHLQPADEVLLAVFDILGDDTYSNEEKIERIFDQIDPQANENMSFESQNEDSPDEAVLDSIESILHGSQSAQKRIQKILNQLANYLHPAKDESNYASALDISQEILTTVK